MWSLNSTDHILKSVLHYCPVLCPKHWYLASNGKCYHYTWSDDALDEQAAEAECQKEPHTTARLSTPYGDTEVDILK